MAGLRLKEGASHINSPCCLYSLTFAMRTECEYQLQIWEDSLLLTYSLVSSAKLRLWWGGSCNRWGGSRGASWILLHCRWRKGRWVGGGWRERRRRRRRGAFLMRDRTRSCSFLLCLDQDCNQSWPAKGFSSETFNSAQTDNWWRSMSKFLNSCWNPTSFRHVWEFSLYFPLIPRHNYPV